MRTIIRFLSDRSAATAIEYGLLVALISISIIGGSQLAGGGVDDVLTKSGNCLTNAANSTSVGGVSC